MLAPTKDDFVGSFMANIKLQTGTDPATRSLNVRFSSMAVKPEAKGEKNQHLVAEFNSLMQKQDASGVTDSHQQSFESTGNGGNETNLTEKTMLKTENTQLPEKPKEETEAIIQHEVANWPPEQPAMFEHAALASSLKSTSMVVSQPKQESWVPRDTRTDIKQVEISQTLQHHLQSMYVGHDETGQINQMMLALNGQRLSSTQLLLTQKANGWSVKTTSKRYAERDLIQDKATALVDSFTRQGLGNLEIKTNISEE